MSYQKDLDEYTEEQLNNELKRRQDLRNEGKCDYCGQLGNTPNCKFPERHKYARLFLQWENRKKAGIREPGTYIGPLGSW